MYVRYLGDIFLQMLKGLILPLIVSSLISAITNLDLSLSGNVIILLTLFCREKKCCIKHIIDAPQYNFSI
nr:unnamed protein product [Callosobruchus chinensis]